MPLLLQGEFTLADCATLSFTKKSKYIFIANREELLPTITQKGCTHLLLIFEMAAMPFPCNAFCFVYVNVLRVL